MSQSQLVKLCEYIVIHLESDVNQVSAEKIKESLRLDRPVLLLINSTGGECSAGYDIAAAVRMNGQVTGIITGTCESMAVAVLVECKTRLIFPEGKLFFHSLGSTIARRVEFLEFEDPKFAEGLVREALGKQGHYEKLIAGRSKVTPDEIRKWCRKNTYVSAQEALEKGLVDQIIEGIEIV